MSFEPEKEANDHTDVHLETRGKSLPRQRI